MMYVVAGLTMIVGTLFALTQSDIKRMLAYSSVAQAGFMLVGVIATSKAGLQGTLVYLLAYGIATIGAFATNTGSDGLSGNWSTNTVGTPSAALAFYSDSSGVYGLGMGSDGTGVPNHALDNNGTLASYYSTNPDLIPST